MELMMNFNDRLSAFFSQLREEIYAMPDDEKVDAPSKQKMSFKEFFAKLRDDIENDRCEPVKLPYDIGEAKDEEHDIENENEVISVTEEAPINEELFDNYEAPDWSDATKWGTPADMDEILGNNKNEDNGNDEYQAYIDTLQPYIDAAIENNYAVKVGDKYQWKEDKVLLAFFIGIVLCDDKVEEARGKGLVWVKGNTFPGVFVDELFGQCDVRSSRKTRTTPPKKYKAITVLIDNVKNQNIQKNSESQQ